MWRPALLLPAFLCLPTVASGSQIHLTRAQLCERAHRIVIGEVTDIETRPSADDSIERKVHLAVSQTVKGPRVDDVIVTAPGGRLNEISVWVEHSPVFLSEATYLLFLEEDGTVVAGEQGTVRLTPPGAVKGETLHSALQSIEACLED